MGLRDHCTPEKEPKVSRRPLVEVADIFLAHGEEYRQNHLLTPEQRRVMWSIERCRTAALGGHESLCLDCGHKDLSYNSCRNRHCPKCQGLAQARWIEERKARILPVTHYHTVFTLPGNLRKLVAQNQAVIYGLLMRCSAETLLEFGQDPKWIGGRIGVTSILHTWTRELLFHPHVHSIVTAGGLSPDGEWLSPKHPQFLFPVRALAKVFRGKFLSGLDRVSSQLDLTGIADFAAMKIKASKKRWVVYAKKPFKGAEYVFEYLGRYTHRTGISNHRLISADDDGICFATKGGNTITLNVSEFIRRFLLHVLPKGFVKIRHYGLLAAQSVNTLLLRAQTALGQNPPSAAPPTLIKEWQEQMKELTGVDVAVCKECGGQITRIRRTARELLCLDSTGPPMQFKTLRRTA